MDKGLSYLLSNSSVIDNDRTLSKDSYFTQNKGGIIGPNLASGSGNGLPDLSNLPGPKVDISKPNESLENVRERETISCPIPLDISNSFHDTEIASDTSYSLDNEIESEISFEGIEIVNNGNETGDENPITILKKLAIENNDKIIIGHLNINHVANKFEQLVSQVRDRLHIFLLTETKLDQSFPDEQFIIEGYAKPFRKDRTKHGGGLLFYVKNDIICKEINVPNLPLDIECLFIEIKIHKSKYIFIGGYNPRKENIDYFLNHISKELDKILPKYDNILLLGDLNSTEDENHLKYFIEAYNLKNLIRKPTCFKNPFKPSSIDIMLTNKKGDYQSSMTLQTVYQIVTK